MKQKDLALIFGSIAAFTILWVGFSLWHVYTTSTIKEPLTSQLLQIPGTFDILHIRPYVRRSYKPVVFDLAFVLFVEDAVNG